MSMRPLGGLAFTAYPANKEWHPHSLCAVTIGIITIHTHHIQMSGIALSIM